MISTEQEFGKACKAHGFSRLGQRRYVRIYGDGLYQTISTGIKKYMDPWSPYYSSAQRKSYCICVDIRSMYWEWPEGFFRAGVSCGFSPYKLVKREKEKEKFQGIWPQYEMMENSGFDALDNIRTQEDYISLYNAVETSYDSDRIHDLSLTAPFFLMGNLKEAEIEISRHFIQSSEAIRLNRKHMDETGFLDYEMRVNLSLDLDRRLWTMCMRRDREEMEQFLNENYLRNMVLAQASGISVHSDHVQRHMPELK